jgi:hypothetical protein
LERYNVIVSIDSMGDLINKVNDALIQGAGWEPIGGVTVWVTKDVVHYCQAIGLRAK